MRVTRRPQPADVRRFVSLLEELHSRVRPDVIAEVTPAQINILSALSRERPTRPSDLAALRNVTRSAISHSLRSLETSGLIRRTRDPARKSQVEVRLTELGERWRRSPSQVDDGLAESLLGRLGLFQRGGVCDRLEQARNAARGEDYFNPRSLFARGRPLRPGEGASRRGSSRTPRRG